MMRKRATRRMEGSAGRGPRLALVVTVRNEVRLLPEQVRVHRMLGVDRVYVYDDGSTDGTLAAAQGLGCASVRPSVDPARYRDDPHAAAWIAAHADLVTARQCLNAYDALARARADGIDWLIHLDADEIALPAGRRIEAEALRHFLARRAPRVDAVRFRVLEGLQETAACDDPFVGITRFKDARRRIPRPWYDPLQDRVREDDWIYGHRLGKWAVRVDGRPLRPRGVHEFEGLGGSALHVEKTGWLLHYAWYGASDLLRRSRPEVGPPTRWLRGPEDAHRPTTWRNLQAASHLDAEGVRAYYHAWIRFPPEVVRPLRRRGRLGCRRPPLVEVPDLAACIRRLRAQSSV